MAASPDYKVYDRESRYQAACKEVEAAAALAALYGKGSTIRYGHRHVVWTEGADGEAGNSYDLVAEVAQERVREINLKINLRGTR